MADIPVDLRAEFYFRRILPSDSDALRLLDEHCYPVRYDASFYKYATIGRYWTYCAIEKSTNKMTAAITCRFIEDRDCEEGPFLSFNWEMTPLLLYIMTLGVLNDRRRTGLGSILLNAAIEEALREKRCRGVFLHTPVENKSARSFYNSHGFELVNIIPNYYYYDDQSKESCVYFRYLEGSQASTIWTPLAYTLRDIVSCVYPQEVTIDNVSNAMGQLTLTKKASPYPENLPICPACNTSHASTIAENTCTNDKQEEQTADRFLTAPHSCVYCQHTFDSESDNASFWANRPDRHVPTPPPPESPAARNSHTTLISDEKMHTL